MNFNIYINTYICDYVAYIFSIWLELRGLFQTLFNKCINHTASVIYAAHSSGKNVSSREIKRSQQNTVFNNVFQMNFSHMMTGKYFHLV